MSKKAFALRVDEQILEAMQRWADDDLRSMNAQIEFVLREALRRAGRLRKAETNVQIEQESEDE